VTPPEVVLAVDIGTSGARAFTYDEHYAIQAAAGVAVETFSGPGGSSTQAWDQVRSAVTACIREVAGCSAAPVAALVLSGTASCLAPVWPGRAGPGRAGPGRPGEGRIDEVILWSDTRASAEQAEIDAIDASPSGVLGPQGGAYQRTLCPAHVSYWPAKLRWLERHHPGPLASARFAGAKDHFFELVTGERWTDPMTAASTGVFDSAGWCWDAELLGRSGASPGQLPEVLAATSRAPLRAGAAAELGLPSGLPVVLGGMDGPLAQVGAAGFSDDIATCTAGTSIAVRAKVAARTPDPAQRLWCYPISRDQWVIGGAGSNGGNILDWVAKLIGEPASVGDVLRAALARPADPSLVFLPYLNGERSPLWRDDLRGAVVGLASHHGPADVARAALDGVAGAIGELAAAVQACVGEPAEVRLTGGLLADDRWAQLITDALGIATSVPEPAEATATGAAVLGWIALGHPEPQPPGPARATAPRSPDRGVHATLSAKSELMRELRKLLFPVP
jgi:gluconokinase